MQKNLAKRVPLHPTAGTGGLVVNNEACRPLEVLVEVEPDSYRVAPGDELEIGTPPGTRVRLIFFDGGVQVDLS